YLTRLKEENLLKGLKTVQHHFFIFHRNLYVQKLLSAFYWEEKLRGLLLMKLTVFHHGDKISELIIYTSVISLNKFRKRKTLKIQSPFHASPRQRRKKSLKIFVLTLKRNFHW